jgi:ribonuclease BN (tRNA processing enzyme)
MVVTWNGTGAAWAPFFGNASAVVETDGRRLLIDCGHTAPARLAPLGLTLQDLHAVFISHLHGDHVYGLEEWGFRAFLVWGIRPPLLIAEELVTPLWEQVLSGTMAQVAGKSPGLDDYFQVLPLRAGEPFAFGPFTLEIRPVRHIPGVPAYGVKVSAEGTAAAFTCDSLADGDSWFYQNTSLVFHDCSFTPYFPQTAHAHFEQLRAYPPAWRERTYLVHYEDDLRARIDDPAWQEELAATQMRLAQPYASLNL